MRTRSMTVRLPRTPAVLLAAFGLCSPSLWAANADLRLPPPTYPGVVALDRADRPAEALALLDRELDRLGRDNLPIEADVVRATLLAKVGRYEESEALWIRVGELESSLKTFALRALVLSLARRGEPTQAETRLPELARGAAAARHLDVTLAVADAHRSAGNAAQAAALYRPVLRRQNAGSVADAARLGLAAALEATGDLEGAIDTFHQAQLRHRLPETFTAARAAERRLSASLRPAPRPFTEDQYRILARRLRRASQFELSKEMLEEWRRVYPGTRRLDVIAAEIIDALYDLRANDEAAAQCEQFFERFPTSRLLSRVRLVQFRLDVRTGQTSRARSRGLDLWRGRIRGTSSPDRRSAGELLAAYLVSVGEVEEGLDVYRELFRTARSAADKRTILWRAGVAALRAGQDERAVINLRGLNTRRPSGDLAPAALYWLGVAEDRVGRQAEALRAFRTVDRRYPYHYYGIRARERLSALTGEPVRLDDRPRDAAAPERQFPTLELSETVRGQAEFRAATVLAKAGLASDAAAHARRLLERRRRNSAVALLAARASAEAGDYARVATLLVNHFGRYLQQRASGLPDDFWRLAYPRPFSEEIHTAAAAHDVDPSLLYSLMRQESRFDPAARSPVGAVGLFQIMSYTAAEVGPAAGVGPLNDGTDEAELMQPSVNARIAAALVGQLTELFSAELAPVAASYNAGEDRVGVWWRAAPGLGEDLFIDTIPYSQTRRFVREVLANYAAYRRLYDSAE